MDSPTYTLETIYADALNQVRELRDAGKLSTADYDMVAGNSKPEDVLTFMNDTILRQANSQSIKKIQVHDKAKPLLDRLDRFGGVIDIFASSSPQLHGVNPARLLVGFMKYLLLIARDIVDTFDTVMTMLEDIVRGLPALQAHINMFGSSQLQLLREPLVDVYAGFIVLGLQAMNLYNRSTLRTIGRSAWSSLENDFKSLISRIEKNRTEVDRIATVEHMYLTSEGHRVQRLESQRAEAFREEQRSSFANTAGTDTMRTSPLPLSFIGAPLDLLSVHSIDRKTELARLDTFFSAGDPHVPQRCAIHGMPGLGKTQLALRYAKSAFDRQKYPIVIWISAATTEKLNQGFTNLLELVRHVDRSHPEQSARLIAARRWLEEYHVVDSNAWLLIVDNANKDTISFLREHLPRKCYGGNILFTTRTYDTAKALASSAGQEHHTFGLQAPGLEDAARILLDYLGLDAATVDLHLLARAKELVNSVGRLPLAVDQAASFMRQGHKTIDDVLELYRSDQKIEAINWENDLSTYQQASVAAAFTAQFKELSRLSPDVYNLMKILSFLDPESISPNVIIDGVGRLLRASPLQSDKKKSGFRDKLKKTISGGRPRVDENRDEAPAQLPLELDPLLALLQSPIQFQKAIHQLQSLSLLQRQTDESTSALRIHDLVQFLTQENTRNEGAQQQWFQCAVTLACGAFQEVDHPDLPTSWSQCEMFVPHIQALTKFADLHSAKSLLLLDANMDVVVYWNALGRYREAEALCQVVVTGYAELLGPTHVDTLLARRILAKIYPELGMYKEAESLFKQLIHEMKQSLGPVHLATLIAMKGLAELLTKLGSYKEAKAIYSRVLTEYQKRLEPDQETMLSSLLGLGNLCYRQGQYGEAKALYEQTLEGRKRRLGNEHPNTLGTMVILAQVYGQEGQYTEAESLLKEALEVQKRQLGSEHFRTLHTMTSLASVYTCQGQHVEAEALYKHVLEIQDRQLLLGSQYVRTLGTIRCLAGCYRDQGRNEEAEALFKHALAEQESLLGLQHPNTLGTMCYLACDYREQGRNEEAEALLKRALAGKESLLGLQHPSTIWTIENLALLFEKQGRSEEAAAMWSKLPPNPPQVPTTELAWDISELLDTSHPIGAASVLQGTWSSSKAGLRRFLDPRRRVPSQRLDFSTAAGRVLA